MRSLKNLKWVLEIFSKYNWCDLLSCINQEDEVWHTVEYFYSCIVRFLIDRCEDKIDTEILLDKAVVLQADLSGRVTRTVDDSDAKNFCSVFSLRFVSPFTGALYK